MPNHILMVFEGEKTEKEIFDNLKQHFLTKKETILYGFHCGEIYSLFNKIKKDEDLRLLTLLKEKVADKNEYLKNIDSDDVSEIYLFFDYDIHASSADINKLFDMLAKFKDETEYGKLYISYPMVEAIKHLNQDTDFKNLKAYSDPNYKNIVSSSGNKDYQNLKKLTKKNWSSIIKSNCKKANFIVNNQYKFPIQEILQIDIAQKQFEDTNLFNEVFVLSAFPMFIADYYGSLKLKGMITASI